MHDLDASEGLQKERTVASWHSLVNTGTRCLSGLHSMSPEGGPRQVDPFAVQPVRFAMVPLYSLVFA